MNRRVRVRFDDAWYGGRIYEVDPDSREGMILYDDHTTDSFSFDEPDVVLDYLDERKVGG